VSPSDSSPRSSPGRLSVRSPAPDYITKVFNDALAANPRFRYIHVRGRTLAKVPLTNQHELAAEMFVFDDAGQTLGKEYGWKHGAVLLWDGVRLEARKISQRPSDHYLVATIPREGRSGAPFFLRLHKAVAAAFHGLPNVPGMLVRHRGDRRDENTPGDLTWGTAKENAADYQRHRERARGRGRGVLIRTKTAREARVKLGIKGDKLNGLLDKLLQDHVAAG
jgi:hypothetical protein